MYIMVHNFAGCFLALTLFVSAQDSGNQIPDNPSLAEYHDACTYLKHMHLDAYETKVMCNSYNGWKESRIANTKAKVTSDQKSYLNSLGANDSRRSKRATHTGKALRKEYRMLTTGERDRFHAALNQLKRDTVDGISKYDLFVLSHTADQAPGAHFGPAFYGYHRELLFRFENALREIDSSLSLPYWDSSLDFVLGDELAQKSIMWTAPFVGNGNGNVIEGPFANWKLEFLSIFSDIDVLHRNLSMPPPESIAMLMHPQAISDYKHAGSLRNLSFWVNPAFETTHGMTHNWVGGIMAEISISPSDPIFFLHHCFIDCLWEQQREELRQTRLRILKLHNHDINVDPQYDYPNDSLALGVGTESIDGVVIDHPRDSFHHALNPMFPFQPLRNIDGLKNAYMDDYYSCQSSPVCTPAASTCGSPNLFCDLSSYRCAPKLQIGAHCDRFSLSKPCMNSECCDGFCRETCHKEPPKEDTSPATQPPISRSTVRGNNPPASGNNPPASANRPSQDPFHQFGNNADAVSNVPADKVPRSDDPSPQDNFNVFDLPSRGHRPKPNANSGDSNNGGLEGTIFGDLFG